MKRSTKKPRKPTAQLKIKRIKARTKRPFGPQGKK